MPGTKFKANDKSFILYLVSKYDIQTKKHHKYYAFAVQQLIHVL
jgi:hypothetical protein